ncbi:MAG: CotH kinase family protein [Muribaculaceae bacterium]|nr:CotH kinase family protein [Muribaculaceae bacterium]
MRRITINICTLLVTLSSFIASALDIPNGTFYFNNKLTKYSVVKFVFGNHSCPDSYVMTMTNEVDSLWSITIPETVTGMDCYCFVETSIDDGHYNETPSSIINRIISQNGKHTTTFVTPIPAGWVFTPFGGNNWTSGIWLRLGVPLSYSGTLPVMFINTEDSVPITSKDWYVYAYYYIDNMGIEGIESVGTAEAPQPMYIRGRGNYSWAYYDKKPYRIKLDKKTALLGMKRNKHWALIANADDYLGFLRHTVGYELSRQLGLAWTPSQQPVEVVLNGDYIGLYFLTETIRVEPDRVNVTEQADYETDSNQITGGWLVEIDNYYEEEQIHTIESNGQGLYLTYKSPEHLSDEQRTYLTDLINTVDSTIYVTDKTNNSWETYIDPDTLACFYIVQELLDDTEGFHGSCFWHKENGDSTKIMFGPVWDFGMAYIRGCTDKFIYEDTTSTQTWIGEIAKFPHFQQMVKKHWRRYVSQNYKEKTESFIDNFIDQIHQAAIYDALRWPDYGNAEIIYDRDLFKSYFNSKYNWLDERWSVPEGDVNCDGTVTAYDVTAIYNYLLNGDDTFLITSDVNNDGDITAADITALYGILLGN